MPEHPKTVGDRATLAVITVMEHCGFRVYLPFSENTRCDLVLDNGVRLARVQCKSGRLRGGAVRFNTCSSYAHHPHPKVSKRDYIGEVDFFAVYCADTGAVYLVPLEDAATGRQAALRVTPPLNRQHRFIRTASQYEMGRVVVEASRAAASD